MLEEKEYIIIDSYNLINKSISISKVACILKDGVETFKQEIDRRAFVVGEIDQVIKYIGKENTLEIEYLTKIWENAVV